MIEDQKLFIAEAAGGGGLGLRGLRGLRGGGRLGFVQNTIYLILPKGSVIFLAPPLPFVGKD